MKNSILNFLTIITCVCFLFSACDKDPIQDFTAVPTPPPPYVSLHPPTAHAGVDIWVGLPVDTTVLNASYSYSGGAPFKFTWRQLSGPNTAIIVHKDSAFTKVTNLTKGDYYFEFSITDIRNLSDQDTVKVNVHDKKLPPNGEVIFKDQTFYCPMGCSIWIDCFSCYVPANKPFKIYIREKGGTTWIEAVALDQWSVLGIYFYEIHGGNLWLSTYYEDNPIVDVKIVY